MELAELDGLVDAYIERYANRIVRTADNVFVEQDLNWWAEEHVQALHHDDPEQLLRFIIRVIEKSRNVDVLRILAAVPLEDLIEYHGPRFIERIELLARTNEPFRDLLHGVWRSSTPDVWARVEAARG